MPDDPLLLNSITDATVSARGRVAICGSHGGALVGALASHAGLRSVILNDAGIGLEDAGIAGVVALDRVGMAAAAVDCMSAEIGSAQDMLDHGVLSFANEAAQDLRVAAGQSVEMAVAVLDNAQQPTGKLEQIDDARSEQELEGGTEILCVDSASLILPADAGRLIVTGSHGGLIGGDPSRACKARAKLVSYCDAGRGKNDVGLSRLPALEMQGIAAVTVSAQSCKIGDAASSLETGRISAANTPALRLGIELDMTLRHALEIAAAQSATR